MAFDTWTPAAAPRVGSTSLSYEDRLLVADYGNFEEMATDGINSLRETWDLSWTSIPDADADDIEAWFNVYGFDRTFKYRVPGRDTALQYNFTQFDRSHASGHLESIKATIRQNFDIEQEELNMQVGIFSLSKNGGNADLAITDAGTVVCTEVTDLAGIRRATIQHDFDYVAGGTPTSVTVYVQTCLETHWIDIARHRFTTASQILLFTVVGEAVLDPAIEPTDGTLASEGGGDEIIQGLLGGKLRLKVVIIGTYAAGSSLASRVHCA